MIVFLVVLKIPAIYLCYVVWWAVKDPPVPGGQGDSVGGLEPDGPEPGGSWWRRRPSRKPFQRGPHGSPPRRPAPAPTTARSRPRV